MLVELRSLITAAPLGAALLVLGCQNPAGGLAVDLGVPALMDVNASSASFEQPVHPSDYQGMVSAWYFGHAT